MSRSRSGRHISAIAPGRSRRICSVSRIASSSLLNVSAPRWPGFALSGKDQTTRYFGTPISQRVDISTHAEASDKAMLTSASDPKRTLALMAQGTGGLS